MNSTVNNTIEINAASRPFPYLRALDCIICCGDQILVSSVADFEKARCPYLFSVEITSPVERA